MVHTCCQIRSRQHRLNRPCPSCECSAIARLLSHSHQYYFSNALPATYKLCSSQAARHMPAARPLSSSLTSACDLRTRVPIQPSAAGVRATQTCPSSPPHSTGSPSFSSAPDQRYCTSGCFKQVPHGKGNHHSQHRRQVADGATWKEKRIRARLRTLLFPAAFWKSMFPPPP